jgi:hypothetical protein
LRRPKRVDFGEHTLTAQASSNGGELGISAPVRVTVSPTTDPDLNIKPHVMLTSPVTGASFAAGEPVAATATASGAAAGDERKQLGPVGIDWDAGKLLLVSVKGLTPGLYEVQLLDGRDKEPEGPGTEAWVLFVRPERFGEALRSFREAEALANGWGDSARTSSKRRFLRAFLGHLDSKGK